jgi:hypothetical protein
VTMDGVWIGELIYWPLIHTTGNYRALSLISTPYKSLHAKSSPACSVFTNRCLVTALNNRNSSTSVLTSLPSGEYSSTEL